MKRFLKGLRVRLSAAHGESIVETLAAVFICALALLMLYTALASAGRMNAQADTVANAARENLFVAEAQQPTGVYRNVTIEGFEESYTVEYFQESKDGYTSYRLR